MYRARFTRFLAFLFFGRLAFNAPNADVDGNFITTSTTSTVFRQSSHTLLRLRWRLLHHQPGLGIEVIDPFIGFHTIDFVPETLFD